MNSSNCLIHQYGMSSSFIIHTGNQSALSLPEAQPLPEQHRYFSLQDLTCATRQRLRFVQESSSFFPSMRDSCGSLIGYKTTPFGLLRTRRWGAGQAGRTASGLGRCTCCSSSRSREPAGPESDRQPAASSHSHRSSSPEGSDRHNPHYQKINCLYDP